MSIHYKIVFSVTLLHEYYTDGFCPDFEIVPSAETASVLSGHGMLWKSIGSKLIVLVRTDSDGNPRAKLAPSKTLTFYLKLNHPHFYNFTNLAYSPAAPRRFYFSNASQAKIGSTLYLGEAIPGYDAASGYAVGSFASNATNDVFEAIRSSENADAHGLAESAYWLKKGKFNYVNSGDLLEFTPMVYLFNTTAATNFTVNVFGQDPATGAYDLPVKEPENLVFATARPEVAVRLETLPPGKYRLEVNGESRFVYLDGDAIYRGIFGVIALVNHLAPANSFALFKASGKPKSTVFTLRFANRSVIWKYLARTPDITAVEDTAPIPALSFTPQAGNQFVSSQPVPMQEKPVASLLLRSTVLGDITPVANPGTDRLGTIVKDGNTYLCAELYLNY